MVVAGDADLGARPPAAGSLHRAGCEDGRADQRQDPLHAPTIFNGRFFNASNIDTNINRPSSFPNISSAHRSGCGIMPSTLPSALRMPAMLSTEPLEFASAVTLPSGMQ